MGVPVRTCVGCRQQRPATDLIRLVADGEQIVTDPSRHRAGRGAWLHADAACLDQAVRRRVFARALRRPGITVDPQRLAQELGLPQLWKQGLD